MTMTETTTRELERDLATVPTYLKATLPAIPGLSLVPGIRRSGDTLPDLILTRHDIPVDRDHVAKYAEVCGFGLQEQLPITYPHLLAFPLHMALLTDRAFPFPAVGLVHLENSITQHRAIAASESLQVTARPQNLRPHRKGRAFDIATQVHSAGELVWEETSTFLRRGAGDEGVPADDRTFEPVLGKGIDWRLGGDLGRRYAAVSGDSNPIHLYPVTAKALGFRRPIAHGMWSKARCLASLAGRIPDAVTVDVAFKKPILLPGTVAFAARPLDTGAGDRHPDYGFTLTAPKSGAAHLLGRTSAL